MEEVRREREETRRGNRIAAVRMRMTNELKMTAVSNSAQYFLVIKQLLLKELVHIVNNLTFLMDISSWTFNVLCKLLIVI